MPPPIPVFVVGDATKPSETSASPVVKPDARLTVSRFVYDQPSFDLVYDLYEPGPQLTPWQNLLRVTKKLWSRKAANSTCGRQECYRSVIRWLPVIDWLPKYDWRSNLLPDVVTGITIGFLNTPQGVAYAMATLTPAVTGLYVSFFPILIYFFMATSRHCSLGTDAVTSVMTSKIVSEHALFAEDSNGNITHPEYLELAYNGSRYTIAEWSQIQIASAAGFLCGIWQFIFGMLGAGGLVVYFSDQLVQGFTCGAAFHVFTSQIRSIFGVKNLLDYYGPFKLIKTYANFFKVIGTAHVPTLILGIVSIAFLVGVKFGLNGNPRVMAIIKIPIPAELFVVIFGTLASFLLDLEQSHGVKIIKKIPLGLPAPSVPDLSKLSAMIGDTFAISVVSLSISITLGLLFANKHGYSIDPNQEFKAQGLAKVFGSFFQCFPSSMSVARTAVQNDVGGKTQIVSLVQCIIIFIVVMALGTFLEPLPKSCLGAIVMVSVFKLMLQVTELMRLWRLSLVDWSIFLMVFLGVVILDVDLGLAVGVGWGIVTIMLRLQKPKVGPLGRLPGTDIYRRMDVYRTALELPGIKIVRVDAPICFVNAAYIKQRLYAWADLNNLIRKWKETHELQSTVDQLGQRDYAFTNNISLDDEETVEAEAAERRVSHVSTRKTSIFPVRRSAAIFTNIDLEVLNNDSVTCENQEDDDVELAVPVKHLIIDCSEVCFLDVTGVGFLKKTHSECMAIDVELLLACANTRVRDMLALCGALDYIKPQQLFVTLHDAVIYAVSAQRRVQQGSNIATPNNQRELLVLGEESQRDETSGQEQNINFGFEIE